MTMHGFVVSFRMIGPDKFIPDAKGDYILSPGKEGFYEMETGKHFEFAPIITPFNVQWDNENEIYIRVEEETGRYMIHKAHVYEVRVEPVLN